MKLLVCFQVLCVIWRPFSFRVLAALVILFKNTNVTLSRFNRGFLFERAVRFKVHSVFRNITVKFYTVNLLFPLLFLKVFYVLLISSVAHSFSLLTRLNQNFFFLLQRSFIVNRQNCLGRNHVLK
jgi:hypothetical protein